MLRKTSLLVFLITSYLLTISSAVQGQGKGTIDSAQKQAVVKDVTAVLNQSYIFLETAAKMGSHIADRLKNGAYDDFNDPESFANIISQDLRSVSKDLHLSFSYNPQLANGIKRLNGQSEADVKKAREESLIEAQKDNFGFRKVERLQGNVGYLDFRYFASAGQAAPTAVAALNFLANCDAVIIDLRQNGGGDPTQIQFMSSYFFEQPTHLNDIYTRESNRTENFWTLPYVPGTKLEKADLYVLTSNFTFSGAEEFSYNMKNLKRATLIGETTGGGAHPVDSKVVQEKFVLNVPTARAINPITKTNWEGTGVTPDISVPSEQAFDRAYILALEKLASKEQDADKKSNLEWAVAAHKAKSNPVRLSQETMAMYAGVYGERKVTLENGELRYQRNGPKYKMIPLNETSFILDGADGVRFEFVVKDGRAMEIIGIYSDGTREPSKRTK